MDKTLEIEKIEIQKILGIFTNKSTLNLIQNYCGDEIIQELQLSLNSIVKNSNKKITHILNLYSAIDNIIQINIDDLQLLPYSIGKRNVHRAKDENFFDLIKQIKQNKFISIDTESKPLFLKGQRSNGIALIQIATDKDCFLFQMKHLKIPQRWECMKIILENQDIAKIAIGFYNDRKDLLVHDIKIKNCIDLTQVMKRLNIKQSLGIKKATALILKKKMVNKLKGISLTNWENPILSKKQIQYATEDTCAIYDVFFEFIKQYPFIKELLKY